MFERICPCCRNKQNVDAEDNHQFLFVMRPKLGEGEEDSSGDASKDFMSRMRRLESSMESKFRDMDNILNKKILGTLQDLDQKTM